MLCKNRPEGFGPSSTLSSPIPTACFVDVVLIPLPIWIALSLLPILFLLSIHHRKQNYDPSTSHLRSRPQRTCAYKTTAIIYYLLVVCNFLMQTLEIARLAILGYGIGLLPFVYVGMILAAGLHWSEGFRGRIRGWQVVNAVVWIGGVVMSVLKCIGLANEGLDARKGSKYPLEDQLVDIAVMAALYAVTAILEVGLYFWKAGRGKRNGELESLDSGRRPVMGMRELHMPK